MDQPLICRTCSEIQFSNSVFSLNNTSNERENFRIMLESCVPDMMLHISKDPVICKTCIDNLKISYEFIKNCHRVERVIHTYIKDINYLTPRAVVDLFKVFGKEALINKEMKKEARETCTDSVALVGNTLKTDHAEMITNSPVTFIDIPERFNIDEVKIKYESTDEIETLDHKIAYNFKQGDNSYKIEEEMMPIQPIKSEGTSMNENEEAYHSDDDLFIESEEDTIPDDNFRPNGSLTRKFKCDKCAYKAYNKRLLDNHKRQKCRHEFRIFLCEECDFKTIRKDHLTRHVFKHNNKKFGTVQTPHPYMCETCGHGFSEEYLLRRHRLQHSLKELPHKCDTCSAHFLRKQELNVHVLMKHSGAEKPHKCDKCNASFYRKYALRRHVMTHEPRRYLCETCRKRFKEKSGLERHMSCHTGDYKFRCAECNYGTSWKKMIIKHIQVSHASYHK